MTPTPTPPRPAPVAYSELMRMSPAERFLYAVRRYIPATRGVADDVLTSWGRDAADAILAGIPDEIRANGETLNLTESEALFVAAKATRHLRPFSLQSNARASRFLWRYDRVPTCR